MWDNRSVVIKTPTKVLLGDSQETIEQERRNR